MPEVRMATDAEVAPICDMLARAFDDDPVACYLMPSDRRRPAMLRAFFAMLALRDHFVDFGGVFTTDDLSGAALWGAPGKPRLTGLRGILALAPLAPRVVGPTLPRAVRFLARLDALHPTEPHWYLSTIGTDPDQRGRGVGSALMMPALARCDAEGVRAYLESSKEANLPFYRRHGFEVTAEVATPGGPMIWQMWREPRPPE
jgi:ribosomal protein S18 acetylase RimI-like enzyme